MQGLESKDYIIAIHQKKVAVQKKREIVYMDNNWIQDFKQVQIDMLKIFIKICEEYDLKYYLIGGSCLGAVRHGGFIPWDDDIDVGMPRKDYDRFSKIAKKELPTNLFFQTFLTDSEYPNIFGKLRNSDTTYIESSVKNLSINHGVYIDVFPLDIAPNNVLIRKSINILMKVYQISVSRCFDGRLTKSTSLFKNLGKKTIWALLPNVKNSIIRRDKVARLFQSASCKYIANYGGAWGEKEVMPCAVFGEGRKILFEGIEVLIPENYDEYLTRLYGDYMTPPPIEKQIGHHYYEIADMKKSYKEYTGGKQN